MGSDYWVVSKVRVEAIGGHDHVTVWNRGGLAGTLIVSRADGKALAERLCIEATSRTIMSDGSLELYAAELPAPSPQSTITGSVISENASGIASWIFSTNSAPVSPAPAPECTCANLWAHDPDCPRHGREKR